jgi:hypothetical protein
MGAPLCHFEFMTNDVAKCKSFYNSLFGWEYDSESMPEYTLVKTGKEPGGGIMKVPPQAPGPALNLYFQVNDLQATLDKAQANGGSVIVPPTPIPNVGSFAMLTDPEGNMVGIFREGQ